MCVLVLAVTSHALYGTTCITVHIHYCPIFNDDFKLHASGKAGGGGYMTWLLATEPSKVVAYPCHYKIPILSSNGLLPSPPTTSRQISRSLGFIVLLQFTDPVTAFDESEGQ